MHLGFMHQRCISILWPRARLYDLKRILALHTSASCDVDGSVPRTSVHLNFARRRCISTLRFINASQHRSLGRLSMTPSTSRLHAMLTHLDLERCQCFSISRPRACLDDPKCIPASCDVNGSPPHASAHMGFVRRQNNSTSRIAYAS